MKIAICQINPTIGDIAGNKEKIIDNINSAIFRGADLVVFGEMALSGTPTLDLASMPDFTDICYSALSDIADSSADCNVLVGMPAVQGEDTFNSVYYIKRGSVKECFFKAMPFSRDELPYFAGLDSPSFFEDDAADDLEGAMPENIIEYGSYNLLVVVGDDLQFIENFASLRPGAARRPDLIIHLCAKKYVTSIIEEELNQLSELALAVKVPLLSVNLVGANTDTVYYGCSSLFNRRGQMVVKMKNFKEDIELFSLKEDDFNSLKSLSLPIESSSANVRHLYKALVCGVRDYFSKSGFSSCILGLSGGIDSAVVAAIAVDALGAQNVHGITMPSKFSSVGSVADSKELAKKLGIKCDEISIEPLFEANLKALSPLFGPDSVFSVAEENLQSRIRGVLLMALANKNGSLVLNTTNKSELAMGYGTLYGDTNGAISILGDVYKTDVYALAEYINRNGELISRAIIEKEPSAELRPDQRDTDSLPPYEELDAILLRLIEENLSPMEISAEGYNIEAVTSINNKLKANEHKRYQLPPVLSVSRCTLGKDRVIPIVSK